MESRTQEWFDLAIERGLHKNLQGAEVGNEVRALAREDNPVATLKSWESHEMLAAIHPNLQRRKPDYDSLNKLARVRGNLLGIRVAAAAERAGDVLHAGPAEGSRGRGGDAQHGDSRAEIKEVAELVAHAQKVVQDLKGRKTNAPKDAYFYLASLPAEMLAFIEVEMPNPQASSKIRNYLQKWRPLRLALPVGELDALGVPRGPKFDKIIEELFELQLRGRGRDPENRVKILRNLQESRRSRRKSRRRKRSGRARKLVAPEGKHEKSKGEAAAATPAAATAKSAPAGEKAAAAAAATSAAKAKGKPAKAAAERASAKHARRATKAKGRDGKIRPALESSSQRLSKRAARRAERSEQELVEFQSGDS